MSFHRIVTYCSFVTLFGIALASSLVVLHEAQPTRKEADEPDRHAKDRKERGEYVPTAQYATRSIEGWTVNVNKELLTTQAKLGSEALRLLEIKLYEIRRAVPSLACEKLQEVPIWLGIDDGHAPCAEYHPSKDWLRAHGYNPDKAKSVEIGNASRFLEWSREQPAMVLHELSHSYFDRVLGGDHAGIKSAYKNAVEGGTYESVMRSNGKSERAYAVTNEQEYFAEASEAFFWTNDFYPFVRAELEKHDPHLYKVLREVWGQ